MFARKIRQCYHSAHNRRSCGNSRDSCYLRQNSFGETPAGRGNFQLSLAGDQIHGRGERAIGALIGNLRREINRHPERHAQNIQQPQERMPP
jgi:hypothetical protein